MSAATKPKETSVNPKDRPWMLLVLLHLQAPRKDAAREREGNSQPAELHRLRCSANPFSSGPRHMVGSPHLLTQYRGRAHRTYFRPHSLHPPYPPACPPNAQPLPHLVTHFPAPPLLKPIAAAGAEIDVIRRATFTADSGMKKEHLSDSLRRGLLLLL